MSSVFVAIYYIQFMSVDLIVRFQLPNINKIFNYAKVFSKKIEYIRLLFKLFDAKKTRNLMISNSAFWYFAKTNVINDGMFPALWDRVCV